MRNIEKRIDKIQEHIMANTDHEYVPSEEIASSAKEAVFAFRKHFSGFVPSITWQEPEDNEDLEIRCTAWLRNMADILREMRLKPEVLERARTIPELESLVRMVEGMTNR